MRSSIKSLLVRVVLLAVVTAAGYSIIVVGFASYFFADMCGNTEIEALTSPDETQKVWVFERNCGATTGFSTQVSLVDPDEALPSGSGNLFIADTDHGIAPSGPRGGPEVRIKWINESLIEIEHDAKAPVFRHETLIDTTRIIYRNVDRQMLLQ